MLLQGAATCEDRALLLGQEGRLYLGPAQRILHRDITRRNDKNDSLGKDAHSLSPEWMFICSERDCETREARETTGSRKEGNKLEEPESRYETQRLEEREDRPEGS